MSEFEIEDILDEYANGELSLTDIIEKYNLQDDADAQWLLSLADDVEDILTAVNPSPEFVATLRQQLQENPNVVERLRQLSRVKVAAGIGGITVAAGILWLARRSAIETVVQRPSTGEASTSFAS